MPAVPVAQARAIALVGPAEGFRGGIVHYTGLLAAALRGVHEVLFIPFSRPYPRWLYPGEDARAPLLPRGTEPGIDWRSPRSWARVVREIRDRRCELVILPWWTAFWTPVYWWILRRLRAATRARILVLCHNVVPHENRAFDRWCARRVLRLADTCFVHSAAEANRLRDIAPRADVRVVRHPVYDMLTLGRLSRAEARRRLGLDPDDENGVLLFFGIVRPYKGLMYLLRAMAELSRTGQRPTLLVAGEFWESRAEYDRMVSELRLDGHVRLVGRYVPDDEVELYFTACDIVVLPYTAVTGSGAAQMARGFRRPIVASALGDLTAVVRDGVDGLLVPPGDPAALAAAITRALADRALLQRGADAAGGASWDDLVREIEQVMATTTVPGAAAHA